MFITSRKPKSKTIPGAIRGLRAWRSRVLVVIAVRRMLLLVKRPWAAGWCLCVYVLCCVVYVCMCVCKREKVCACVCVLWEVADNLV